MHLTDAQKKMKWPHIAELDGVRAVAVMIVFVSHIGNLKRVIPGGLGVTIFFFLSGYLITSLLRVEGCNTGKVSFAEFYTRRTFRIFPPLYVTLLVSALLLAFGVLKVETLDAGSVASQIFFMSNYERLWGPHAGLPGPPLWSLAVEEHFYLIFPLIFAGYLMRMKPRRAAVWCVCACLVPLLARMVPLFFGGDLSLNYFLSHTRADSILAGCALALWNNPVLDDDAWKPTVLQFGGAVALILVAALYQSAWFAEVFRYTFQAIGLYVVFSFIIRSNRLTSPVLRHPVAQLIGKLSYTIYLVHVICLMIAEQILPNQPLITVALTAVVMTFSYAWLMNIVVERPINRLRPRAIAALARRRSS